jgi:hypothetical protein
MPLIDDGVFFFGCCAGCASAAFCATRPFRLSEPGLRWLELNHQDQRADYGSMRPRAEP